MASLRYAFHKVIWWLIFRFNRSGVVYVGVMIFLMLWLWYDPGASWVEVGLKLGVGFYAIGFVLTLWVILTNDYILKSSNSFGFWRNLRSVGFWGLADVVLGSVVWPVTWLEYEEDLRENWIDLLSRCYMFWKIRFFGM